MSFKEKETHESFGMLQFNRISSNQDKYLFGSSIANNHTIQLTISEGAISRDLNTDWYYAGKQYIEVEMSQVQFAEAITSLNCGSGVPVTIRRLDGKEIQECQFTNKRIQFEQEFRKDMKNIEKQMDELVEKTQEILKSKKNITVSERQTILEEIQALRQHVASNIPYMSATFNEQMDKTVTEAKGEIDAFVMNKVNTLGMQKLEELKLLNNKTEL